MNGAVQLPLDLPELSFLSAGDSLVRRSVLPSGVRILSEKVPGARSATIGYWVAVGSRDETPSTFGSTHFLEHLLFKGTTTRSALDIAVSFDAVGGEHNAMTAKEYTCYYAKIQDRDLPMAIEVISDMLTSSLLDPEEFETERGVILEELAMADDDPGDVTSERFFEAVLGDHALGRPIGGSPETIAAATRDSVWNHYRANYRAQDLVITVAGAVDHDELVAGVTAALRRADWNLDTTATPVSRRSATGELIERGSALTVVQRPIEQANILLGVEGLAASDPRRSTLAVLNSVLGGGMSSRLFQEVREKRGLVYSVFSFHSSYADDGQFVLYAGTGPERLQELMPVLVDEIHKVVQDPVKTNELARAKTQMRSNLLMARESMMTRAGQQAKHLINFKETLNVEALLQEIEGVNIASIQSLAADIFSSAPTIAALGPLKQLDSYDKIAKRLAS